MIAPVSYVYFFIIFLGKEVFNNFPPGVRDALAYSGGRAEGAERQFGGGLLLSHRGCDSAGVRSPLRGSRILRAQLPLGDRPRRAPGQDLAGGTAINPHPHRRPAPLRWRKHLSRSSLRPRLRSEGEKSHPGGSKGEEDIPLPVLPGAGAEARRCRSRFLPLLLLERLMCDILF